MPDLMADVFNSDHFNLVNMTKSIQVAPYAPKTLGQMNLFQTEGVNTTTVLLEREGSTIQVLPTLPRGSAGTKKKHDKRKMRSLVVPHIPHEDEIRPDAIRGVREFDSSTQLKTVAKIVSKHLAAMRENHEVTFEWHRVGAIQGLVKDADGSTLVNLFTEFGVTETEIFFDLDNNTNVLATCESVKRALETALGADTYTQLVCICGDSFWDKLISNSSVKTAYERWQNGQFLRQVDRINGFEFGDITFKNYRGSINGTPFIPTDVGRIVPMGVPNVFKHFMAPADFNETVNTLGQLIYARQENRPFGRGVDIHTQSNPLIICRRPEILIKCNEAAS